MSNNDNAGGFVLTGKAQMDGFHLLRVRRALKLEIESGMRLSGGRSVAPVARRLTKTTPPKRETAKSRRELYAALDAKVVTDLGMPSAPLRTGNKS
jgi:hypothetical protein